MSSSSLTVAQQGFDAWRRGDFDALGAIFAPDVEWRWFEPGGWDCHSRDDVMRTLRQRHAAGFAEGRLKFHDAGSDVVVTAHPSEIGGHEWPDETSTVIRFHEGKVAAIPTSTNRRRTWASWNRAVPALPRLAEPRSWNCRRRTSAGIREYHLAMIRQACTGCGCDQCPCPDCTKK